jgi:hypothetical protein
MINDEQMDYFHAIGAKFRPKSDNLKLMIVAGAAFFSAIILTVLLTAFYWNGDWHGLKTMNGEVIQHSDGHSTDNHKSDPADTHSKPPAKDADHH